jgi:hypothetical protein
MSSSKLSYEIERISNKVSCACPVGEEYSPNPIESVDNDNLGYPFIDQVIYREWNPSIIFSETSTVFHRTEGRIKWYKSKSNNNTGNPIYIDGELNEDFWEVINDCCEYKAFRYVTIATEGQIVFNLPYSPDTILLVSINGQGPLSNISDNDYTLSGNVLTLKAPNLTEEGDEIVVIASYDTDQFINPPFGTGKISTNDNFVYSGSNSFTLNNLPTYVRSVVVNGYSLGTDLFSYSISSTTVTIDVDPPEFVLNTGDKIFIEYNYIEQ